MTSGVAAFHDLGAMPPELGHRDRGRGDFVGFVVEGTRQNACRRRLADAAHARQHIAMRDPTRRERVRERLHHGFLPDEIIERLRPILPRKHDIRFRRSDHISCCLTCCRLFRFRHVPECFDLARSHKRNTPRSASARGDISLEDGGWPGWRLRLTRLTCVQCPLTLARTVPSLDLSPSGRGKVAPLRGKQVCRASGRGAKRTAERADAEWASEAQPEKCGAPAEAAKRP